MPAKAHDRLSTIVHEVEKLAKELRGEIRSAARKSGFEQRARSAARQLRKRAAHAAESVEAYVHRLRVDLEGRRAKGKSRSRTRPARKRTARARTA